MNLFGLISITGGGSSLPTKLTNYSGDMSYKFEKG